MSYVKNPIGTTGILIGLGLILVVAVMLLKRSSAKKQDDSFQSIIPVTPFTTEKVNGPGVTTSAKSAKCGSCGMH